MKIIGSTTVLNRAESTRAGPFCKTTNISKMEFREGVHLKTSDSNVK